VLLSEPKQAKDRVKDSASLLKVGNQSKMMTAETEKGHSKWGGLSSAEE